MPSSYTTNLRLTLPATGENSGTWGTLVNNGITTLIDTSIAGTASVTMTDANYVLTSINGATDEARSMFITLSGTLSTTRNVICPSVSKLYIVTNNTTGGQSIVFTTLAGTGITVPNGRRAIVYCNGTNVVSAFDYFSGPYVIEANSASSALRVTQVGSGNAILVEDSANPDSSPFVVDATGNVGIGTTTPAANGLDVVRNGATALVRVLQSDSGAGTFARLLVSKTSGPSVETLLDSAAAYFGTVGSHPLLIETNATERVRITASGLVGINTSTPDANLTVNGVASFSAGTALLPSIAQAGDLNTGMWFPAADTLAWSTAGTERLRIGASGAITLPDLTASTALALDASKNVVSVTNTGTGSNVLATSPTLVTPNLGTPSAIVLTNASGTASININGTVGATTPTTGAFTTVAASAVDGFRNTNAFAAIRLLQTAGGVGYRWALANDGNFYMQRTADGFATAASTPMFVGSNDRIGIGTTTPDALLTVNGVAAFGAGTALLPSLAGPTDPDTGMWFPPGGNIIAWSTGGLEAMRTDSSQNVGIGTSSPVSRLHVDNGLITSRRYATSGAIVLQRADGTQSAPTAIASSGSVGVVVVRGYDGSAYRDIGNLTFVSDGAVTNTSSPGYFAIAVTPAGSVSAQERMRIDSAGNVGIGTTSPSAWGKFAAVGTASGSQVVAAIVNTASTADSQAVLSLDTYGGGVGIRDSQIRARNSGTNATTLEFYTSNGASPTEKMRINATGEVGIGKTAATGVFLDVNGNIHANQRLQLTSTVANLSLLEVAGGTGYRWTLANNGTYRLQRTQNGLYTDVTTPMIFDASNNVGINETAPDYKLDVNGTFGFTPGASVTPVDNGDVVFEATNNTTLTVKLKGSDGTVRTGTITLA